MSGDLSVLQDTAAWSFSLPGAPVDCGRSIALPQVSFWSPVVFSFSVAESGRSMWRVVADRIGAFTVTVNGVLCAGAVERVQRVFRKVGRTVFRRSRRSMTSARKVALMLRL